MSAVPPPLGPRGADSVVGPQYAAARTVLLDALEALAPHHSALIVVGAQAVYLRTGSAGLTIAPFTTDGDLALDPSLLGDDPLLEEAMRAGGFQLRVASRGAIEPGTWVATIEVGDQAYDVPVDLIVPEAVLAGGKTRGARLPVHGKRAALRTHGLEAALVDRGIMTLTALAEGDQRRVDVAVAGVASLLVAKVIKIAERVADDRRPHRQKDKDAGDVLRLVRATPAAHMAERLTFLRADPIAAAVTSEAIDGLGVLFAAPTSPGVAMAIRAVQTDLPAEQVEVQLTTWTRTLLRALSQQ